MGLLHKPEEKRIYSGFVVDNAHQACDKIKTIIESIDKVIGLNSDQSFDVRVILSELLQNAIRHGNISSQQKKVYMNVWIKNNETLNITIKDQGKGFNAFKVLDEEQNQPNNEVSELMECGRGLRIVQSLCDDISFNQRGNCITIRKKLL